MAPLLQDPKRSSIRIVLNPERMVINESQRLYTYLNLFGFPVDAVIANRVLPPEARSQYFDRWFDIQAGHLAEARQSFEPLPFFQARLFDREMVGLPLLDEFGARGLRRARPDGRVLRGEADGGEEGGRGLRARTSACPSRRRTASRSARRARSWWSRWTTSGATCCCRAPSPRACWRAPPSRTSGCAWASERRRRMPAMARRPVEEAVLPGLGAARGDRASTARRCARRSAAGARGHGAALPVAARAHGRLGAPPARRRAKVAQGRGRIRVRYAVADPAVGGSGSRPATALPSGQDTCSQHPVRTVNLPRAVRWKAFISARRRASTGFPQTAVEKTAACAQRRPRL